MEPITAKTLICALRPFLGNTQISTNDKNWNAVWSELPFEWDRITAYLDNLKDRVHWETCSRCGREFNNLTEEMICIECFDANEASKKREAENGQYLAKVLGNYGLEKYSFASFSITADNAKAARACMDFKAERDNLYLYGQCGVGKTHLAGAILKAAASAGKSLKWVNSLYISRMMKSRFPSEEEALVEGFVWPDVLIIDDFGLGKDADTLLRFVYELSERRLKIKKNGWVITSNYGIEDLTKRFGDDRLGSRLAEMFRFYQLSGANDWRLQLRRHDD